MLISCEIGAGILYFYPAFFARIFELFYKLLLL
nr:MAG TPA: hypothetical protein [Caudoviricetes sp.]